MKKHFTTYSVIPALIIFGLAAISAVGITVIRNRRDFERSRTETALSSLTAALPGNLLSPENVEQKAIAVKPDSLVTGIELEQDNGTYIYKVILSSGQPLHINAQTGEVVNDEVAVTNGQAPKDPLSEAGIGFANAREIALTRKRGGIIAAIKLEQEDETLIYKVLFDDDSRIDIRAQDGVVLKSESGKKKKTKTPILPSSQPEGAPTKSGSTNGTNATPSVSKPELPKFRF